MKKLFTLILALIFSLSLKAQCLLTQAVDFTATDIHGKEVHLFDILDGGQYVLIDFFFTTCVTCQQTISDIVRTYSDFGCNQNDVFYMEIAKGDSDEDCINWVNTYGVEYPTISGVAGGTSICSQYGISFYPTVILISPNQQIVIQDLWPINNQTIINRLEVQGIEQHNCYDILAENNHVITLYPNPANESVILVGENLGTVRVHNTLGQKMDEFEANGNELRINTTSYGNGVYFIKADGQTMKFVVKH